jgi:hypothetical protein
LAPGSDVGGSLYRSSAASLASFTDGLPPSRGVFRLASPKKRFLDLGFVQLSFSLSTLPNDSIVHFMLKRALCRAYFYSISFLSLPRRHAF